MPPKKKPKITSRSSTRSNKSRWSATVCNETAEEGANRRAASRGRQADRTMRTEPGRDKRMPATEVQVGECNGGTTPPPATDNNNSGIASRLRPRNGPRPASRPMRAADYYKCALRALSDNEIEEHYLGPLSGICDFCGSLNFEAERTLESKIFSSCCHGGKVDISLPKIPSYLTSLVSERSADNEHFLENIRSYNSMFAFASLEAKIQRFHGGVSFFKIQGQMYHRFGSLHANDPQQSRYSQLYILDPKAALDVRKDVNQHCAEHEHLMANIDSMLRKCNPYAAGYRMMKEVEDEEKQKHGKDAVDIRMYLTCTRKHDKRLYNLQRSNEVALIFNCVNGQSPSRYDLCIQPRDQPLRKISNLNSNGDPMAFPLLFPCGERGWGPDLRWTMLQHYAYMLGIREEMHLQYCSRLFEQYIVMAWANVESTRLKWVEDNQKTIRSECYSGLMDHLARAAESHDGAPVRVGKPCILPSSFIGGERHKQEDYQDAMGIVRWNGPPHLFVTFTANPKWKEITENLLPGQEASDRPDLVSRVFHLKLEELKRDIFQRKVFGNVRAWVYSIEFQKRGLPHAHILLIMHPDDKITAAADIDNAISAEIPDKETHPRLFETVTRHMIHGPCGITNPKNVCMEDGKCTKRFPKELRNATDPNVDGYPLYRRRAGTTAFVTRKGKLYEVDNSWVVPHNRYLMYKYNAHINVEVCASIKSVKYLYKYIYKGHDKASLVFQGDELVYDEVKHYVNARYVGSPEAMWRLREYEMSAKSHKVERLSLHLPDMQNVIFTEGDEALAIAKSRDTKLTAWFKLNADEEQPEARQYLYGEIPVHYRFITSRNEVTKQMECYWQAYKKHVPTVSRIYFASPTNVELYHLRILLLHVRGATSFADLYTVDGVPCATFKEACRRRDLLHDDEGNKATLEEAATFKSSRLLRQTFAIICAFCEPENELLLWETFKDRMIDDFRQHEQSDAERLALADIRRILQQHSYDFANSGLPDPGDVRNLLGPQRQFNPIREMQEAEEKIATFTAEQRELFSAVCNAFENFREPQRYFYLDGFGGSGKTYFYKAVLNYFRGKEYNVIAVAWTGIAARLLKGGRTVHGQFKLPLDLNEESKCNIPVQHKISKYIYRCPVIVWDEISMATRFALEAIDRYLVDLMQDKRPFGGKIVLVGGDFRQTLPVVQKGTKESILNASVKASDLWKHFKKFQFTENKRSRPGQKEFSEALLRLGDGKAGSDLGEDVIKVDEAFLTSGNIIEEIFGTEIDIAEVADLASKAILCPKNVEALEMNEKVLSLIKHGQVRTYYSTDFVRSAGEGEVGPEEMANYPLEFLHSLTPSGFPPHQLNVKIGAIIILLRNMEISLGLCNGTRLIVRNMGRHIIEGEVFSRIAEERVKFMIPRITFLTGERDYPFILGRKQFPIRLSFIMTINKAQGQEFDKVGIYLPAPIFAHGQLYTAFSRAKAANDVKVQIVESEGQGKLKEGCEDVFTQNVVYREIFGDSY